MVIAPPLVLLHGFTHTGASWDGVITALGERYLSLAPDIRGLWRTRGVRLVATDLRFSAGVGPEVRRRPRAVLLCPAILGNARFAGYSANNVTVTAYLATARQTDR